MLSVVSVILRRIYFILFKRQQNDLPLFSLRNLLLSYGEELLSLSLSLAREFPFQVSTMPVASTFDRQAIELRSRDPAR